jgi:hypothetical protein
MTELTMVRGLVADSLSQEERLECADHAHAKRGASQLQGEVWLLLGCHPTNTFPGVDIYFLQGHECAMPRWVP